jgi:3-deoxy-D-manno-octulosonic-acid transferase
MSGQATADGLLSRFCGEALLAGYRLFGRIANPALAVVWARRARRGKEDPERRGERFGHASQARPEGRLVWLHAASVGEMNAAEPLLAALLREGAKVLLTTGTVTSARIAESRVRAGVIHQFVPYDTPGNIGRFLDHWHPDLAITLESEIWPTTITSLSDRRIPLVIASATMSERSEKSWSRVPMLARRIFSRIALCLAQTETDASRLAAFGARRVVVAGNLKFDSRSLPADPEALAELRRAIGARPVWLAASTHEGEEAIVGRVHTRLKARFPGLLTLLVPRHPERGAEIAALLRGHGLAVTRRAEAETMDAHTDIYLADTIGEMGLFYRLAPVAFIGKSLVSEGGQNPLEAARLDSAILTGPHVSNLEDIYAPLIAAGGAYVVEDEEALWAAVAGLLEDPALAARRAATAARVVDAGSGALARTLEALTPLLAPPAAGGGTGPGTT